MPSQDATRTQNALTERSVLLERVNDSGFPFQYGIKRKILVKAPQHRWTVLTTEHRWTDPMTDAEGFIDIVLEHGRMHAVI